MSDELTNLTGEKRWWTRFFDKFGETGNVTVACEYAKISRVMVYDLKKNNPAFADKWKRAEELGFAALEDTATKRAARSSDTLLIFLLKCRGREKYGDVIRQELSGSVDLTYDNLSDDDIDRRIAEAEARKAQKA